MDKIQALRDSDDFTTPHNCDAAYIASNMGVDIEEEHAFQEELHGIVDKMQQDLVHETKILEGTLEPVYKNELSDEERKEEQWKTDSPSGCWTIAHTHIYNGDSNTLSCTAGLLNPEQVIRSSGANFPAQLSALWQEISGASGPGIEPSNESSDCTEQTINVPMLGTPSEEK